MCIYIYIMCVYVCVCVTYTYMSLTHLQKKAEVQHGIRFSSAELAKFWNHWKNYFPFHPAAEKQPPHHTPIGFFGDDTSYSLAGAKAIVMLVSFCLHKPGPNQMSRFPWCVCFEVRAELGRCNLGPTHESLCLESQCGLFWPVASYRPPW